ncbi:hypothetical protein SAMN02745165_00807 [Malonomonas rubra DSM 5091]|uniref:NHL repeat-containing protein n=1 Tax=Malonomonas rubra DSM 5091 TaxID=1122189 RepID=A0A1M6DUF4_MALRU|nr:NHL repeat-containing protein [Malonomonas rubra]SHI76760.1 hypothetical protein SAMN02745165_00807 [Malonomonas rubra DSM 5091]
MNRFVVALLVCLLLVQMMPAPVFAGAPQLQAQGKLRSCESLTTGVTVDNAGNLFLSKARLQTISKFDIYGRKLEHFTPLQIGEGGVAVSPMGNIVYAAAGKSVLTIDGYSGEVTGRLGAEENEFDWVTGLELDDRGYIYVADSGSRKVRIYNPAGEFQSEFAGPGEDLGQLGFLSAMAINLSAGEVWVADNLAKGVTPGPKIVVYDLAGQFLREIPGSTGFGQEPIGSFSALTFDHQGRVYVLDGEKNEIRTLDPRTGGALTYDQFGPFDKRLVGHSSLAFDPATSRLFVGSGQEVFILGVDGAVQVLPQARR